MNRAARVSRPAIPRFLLLLLLLACALPVTGCSGIKKWLDSRKKTPESADRAHEMYIGVVESVNPEQKFVLIRTEIRMTVVPGTDLVARSANGSRASLTVTPERKMNFLSADIIEGSPATGDIVLLPVKAEPEPPAPSTSAAASPEGPSMIAPGSEAPALPAPAR